MTLSASPKSLGLSGEDGPSSSNVLIHVLLWSVPGVVAGLLFTRSYQAWGHPIIDLGRDLYLAQALRDGHILYRDLAYNYGPFAPYFLAWSISIFGDNLATFETIGCLTAILTTIALYRIGIELTGVLAGFLSALCFIVLNVFAWSSWGCNFVLPYSYAATIGLTTCLWSFYFLIRFLYGGRIRSNFIASIVLLYLTLITKQEFALITAGVQVTAWVAHGIPRRQCGLIVLGAIGWLGVLAIVFQARNPDELSLWRDNVGKLFGSRSAQSFFRYVGGLSQPGDTIVRTFKSAGAVIILFCAPGAAYWLACRRTCSTQTRIVAFIFALAVSVLVVGKAVNPWFLALMPFTATAVMVLSAIRDRRDPMLLLSMLVLLSAIRIPLAYGPFGYGFALAVPAYPFLLHFIEKKLIPQFPSANLARCTLVVVMTIAMFQFDRMYSQVKYNKLTSRLSTPKGTLRNSETGRTEAIGQFLEYMKVYDRDARSMVVFPEGVSLNYFLDIPNPIGQYLFIPPEIDQPHAEERLIHRLERHPPDIIAIVERNVKEYGKKPFGSGYALRTTDWIREHYRHERTFSGQHTDSSERWFLQMLVRNLPNEQGN